MSIYILAALILFVFAVAAAILIILVCAHFDGSLDYKIRRGNIGSGAHKDG